MPIRLSLLILLTSFLSVAFATGWAEQMAEQLDHPCYGVRDCATTIDKK